MTPKLSPDVIDLLPKLEAALDIHTIAGKAILRTLLENAILMERKQLDYGPGNIADWGIAGVGMRLNDKTNRIKTLLSRPRRKPQNESLRDSFQDASVYGAIGQVVIDGLWPTAEPLLAQAKKSPTEPFVPIKVDVDKLAPNENRS